MKKMKMRFDTDNIYWTKSNGLLKEFCQYFCFITVTQISFWKVYSILIKNIHNTIIFKSPFKCEKIFLESAHWYILPAESQDMAFSLIFSFLFTQPWRNLIFGRDRENRVILSRCRRHPVRFVTSKNASN